MNQVFLFVAAKLAIATGHQTRFELTVASIKSGGVQIRVSKIARLALLAPAVIKQLVAGAEASIELSFVLHRAVPLDWREQGAVFAGR